ncbi:hypothetical protein BLOT_005356, partial [Blomia tropicalis]
MEDIEVNLGRTLPHFGTHKPSPQITYISLLIHNQIFMNNEQMKIIQLYYRKLYLFSTWKSLHIKSCHRLRYHKILCIFKYVLANIYPIIKSALHSTQLVDSISRMTIINRLPLDSDILEIIEVYLWAVNCNVEPNVSIIKVNVDSFLYILMIDSRTDLFDYKNEIILPVGRSVDMKTTLVPVVTA